MRGRGVLLLCAALAAAACGSPAEQCPNDQPDSCPSPIPSYAGEVQAIIQSRCATCHVPGGLEATKPLQTYMQVYGMRLQILAQVSACKMPLAPEPPLTADERRALMGWIACMAPNN